MILVSDQVSSTIVKNAVHRLRPCHTPEIMDMVHLVNGVCGGTFGYFSTHASNTTALALFMILLLRDGATAQFALGYGFRVRRSVLFIFLAGYAVLVSYSRIYLGCHYPSDVFTGIAFGGLLSFIFAKIFFRFSGAKN